MRHAGDVLKDAAHPSSEDGDLERVLLRSEANRLASGADSVAVDDLDCAGRDGLSRRGGGDRLERRLNYV